VVMIVVVIVGVTVVVENCAHRCDLNVSSDFKDDVITGVQL
jgi:hypothetical protein